MPGMKGTSIPAASSVSLIVCWPVCTHFYAYVHACMRAFRLCVAHFHTCRQTQTDTDRQADRQTDIHVHTQAAANTYACAACILN